MFEPVDAPLDFYDFKAMCGLIKPMIDTIEPSLDFNESEINAVKPSIHSIKPVFRDPGKRFNRGINAITEAFLNSAYDPCF